MGRKVKVFNYLKVDLIRAMWSWKFLIGILGVCLVMYIASLEGIASDTNVTYVVWLIVYGMLFMISLVFSAFPFAGCFCEDFEQKREKSALIIWINIIKCIIIKMKKIYIEGKNLQRSGKRERNKKRLIFKQNNK